MRGIRVLVLTVLMAVLLAGTAYGAGYAVRQLDHGHDDAASSERAEDPALEDAPDGADSDTTDAGTPGDSDTDAEPKEPEPAGPVLKPGQKGEDVRALQHRLFQIAWLPEKTTGTYDAATREAVSGFQAKRGLRGTGVVDQKTWGRLLKMTRVPTHDEKFNILRPGPRLLGKGDTGDEVRDLQARLKQIDWLSGLVSGTYDPTTVEAIRGFQAKREIPVTGEIDQRTQDRLHEMTSTPSHEEKHNITPPTGSTDAALDPRCLTGRALCVDKSSQTLRWVINGKVQTTYDVRFGSEELPTREGAFTLFSKSRDHVSSIYDTSMPFAMFFSGGQAIHYSPDFAATGYDGASHGCVNVRDYDGIVWLFDQVDIGDKVIVYWS